MNAMAVSEFTSQKSYQAHYAEYVLLIVPEGGFVLVFLSRSNACVLLQIL